VIETNPAHAIRGPKHVVTKGKTPILTAEETRTLIESIDAAKLAGIRDRVLLAVMLYSFARVGAVTKMNVEAYLSVKPGASPIHCRCYLFNWIYLFYLLTVQYV